MNTRNAFLTVLRLFICIAVAGITILAYIEKQNDLTGLRLAIPSLAKEVKVIEEENIRLSYEIEHFNRPEHLTQLSRKPEFSHLKSPYIPDLVILQKMPHFPEEEKSGENL